MQVYISQSVMSAKVQVMYKCSFTAISPISFTNCLI